MPSLADLIKSLNKPRGKNILDKLEEQSFRPGDSVLASAINHPIDAVSHGLDWLNNQVNTAVSPYTSSYEQLGAANNLAGLAQLGAMPMAPASRGGTLGTVSRLSDSDNLNESLLQKYLTTGKLSPEELAQYEANAVKMRESNRQFLNVANADAQGGTAMDRAKGIGFDTDAFHGTASDFPEFSIKKSQDKEGSKLGMGWGKDKMYFADTGGAASAAASGAEYFGKGNSQNVIPSRLSLSNPIHSDEYAMMVDSELQNGLTRDKAISKIDKTLKKHGVDGIISDVGGMAVFNPNQIRSRFAAFDPLRKDSADLLASWLLPVTMLGAGMYGEKQNKRSLSDLLGYQ